MLQEMSRACKPDGQILLLEHGVGTSPWINKMLHNGAEQHCKHWGCQWDRDIEGIVREVCCYTLYLSLMGFALLLHVSCCHPAAILQSPYRITVPCNMP